MTAEELRRIFGLPPVVSGTPVGVVPDTPADGQDDDDESDDITWRIRHATPCLTCHEVCEEAAHEIEKLREFSIPSAAQRRPGDEILQSLSSAIVHTDPCGRPECVAVGPHFLAEVRDELVRLRRLVSLAAGMTVAARVAWRDEIEQSPRLSRLLSAVQDFERESA